MREARLKHGWTLADVHGFTGLSISTLSKIETGKVDPHYTKIMLLCETLGVDIAQIIGDEPSTYAGGAVESASDTSGFLGRRIITRKGDEAKLSDNAYHYRLHAAELLQRSLHPMVLTVRARTIEEFGELMRHSGEEFTYVLKGTVAFYSDLYAPTRLNVGDSIYFDAEMGHAWLAVSEGECVILSTFTKSRDNSNGSMLPDLSRT